MVYKRNVIAVALIASLLLATAAANSEAADHKVEATLDFTTLSNIGGFSGGVVVGFVMHVWGYLMQESCPLGAWTSSQLMLEVVKFDIPDVLTNAAIEWNDWTFLGVDTAALLMTKIGMHNSCMFYAKSGETISPSKLRKFVEPTWGFQMKFENLLEWFATAYQSYRAYTEWAQVDDYFAMGYYTALAGTRVGTTLLDMMIVSV